MAFKEAKHIVKTKLDKKVSETPEGGITRLVLKTAYANLKGDFDNMIKKTSSYIGSIDYTGNKADKRKYLRDVDRKTGALIDDDKVLLPEFFLYKDRLDSKTKLFKERLVARQRAAEIIKFENIKEANNQLVIDGNFAYAMEKLDYLERRLSPVSRTNDEYSNDRGNLGEKKLRLDLQIKEEINALATMEALYKGRYKEGNSYLGPNGKNFFILKVEKGVVSYHSITKVGYDSDKRLHYQYTKTKKINWMKFKKMMVKEKCVLAEYDSIKPSKKLPLPSVRYEGWKKFEKIPFASVEFAGIKEKGVDVPASIMQDKANILEIKRLKEINFI
jgi:hypothetical protein